MLMLVMIKNMRIQKLIETMKKNGFSKAYISRETKISYAQINRYMAGTSVPIGLNNIEKIDKFIAEHNCSA